MSRTLLLASVLVLAVAACAYLLLQEASRLGIDALSLSPHDVEEFVAAWGMWGVAGSLLLIPLFLASFVLKPLG